MNAMYRDCIVFVLASTPNALASSRLTSTLRELGVRWARFQLWTTTVRIWLVRSVRALRYKKRRATRRAIGSDDAPEPGHRPDADRGFVRGAGSRLRDPAAGPVAPRRLPPGRHPRRS